MWYFSYNFYYKFQMWCNECDNNNRIFRHSSTATTTTMVCFTNCEYVSEFRRAGRVFFLAWIFHKNAIFLKRQFSQQTFRQRFLFLCCFSIFYVALPFIIFINKKKENRKKKQQRISFVLINFCETLQILWKNIFAFFFCLRLVVVFAVRFFLNDNRYE